MSKQVFEIDHPLAKHHLTRLRDKNTSPAEFRANTRCLATLLAVDVFRDLELGETTVDTPLTRTKGYILKERVGIVPILRAGLGLVEPVLDILPDAEVWHLGLYRDEESLKPVEYYKKFPPKNPVDTAIVLDPMLATGGSAIAAVEAMQSWGVQSIKFMAILAAPEGIAAFHEVYPDIPIYVCKIDSHLNDVGYIVPGLGDAGDRIFNAQAH
jgi:uracil phosphoribosyltransferase